MKKFFKVLGIALLSVMFLVLSLVPISNTMAQNWSPGLHEGMLVRPTFTRQASTVIVITGGIYHHYGASEQILIVTDVINYTPNTSGIGWWYIYIDDTDIQSNGNNLISGDDLYVSTTAPVKSYNARYHPTSTYDRCIFAYYNDQASVSIRDFYHDGGRYVEYWSTLGGMNFTDIDTSWTDVTVNMPDFGDNSQASVLFEGWRISNDGNHLYHRKNGSDSSGMRVGYVTTGVHRSQLSKTVTVDINQKIEVRMESSGGSKMAVSTMGFFLPMGM